MPKNYSSREILSGLRKAGFTEVSQHGSHIKLRKVTGSRTLTVIVKHPTSSIPLGTFRSILRQAELTQETFERLLQ